MPLGHPETNSLLSSHGTSVHMGYLQSSLIHPPYDEQKLGALVVLFKTPVPYHAFYDSIMIPTKFLKTP